MDQSDGKGQSVLYVCAYACVCISCFLNPLLSLIQPIEACQVSSERGQIAPVHNAEKEEKYACKREKVEKKSKQSGVCRRPGE